MQLPHSIQHNAFDQSKPLTKFMTLPKVTQSTVTVKFLMFGLIQYFVDFKCTKHNIRRKQLNIAEKS